MYKRAHHQRIAKVLGALDADLFKRHQCWFGGGTAIALAFDEFRESRDIDFLVSHRVGYTGLRELLTGPSGISSIVRTDESIQPAREIRADQYGLRTMLRVDGEPIKFEIVLEGRVNFEIPSPQDEVGGVQRLSLLDLATSKLLANSDRWGDASVYQRDIIDLAMMRPSKALLLQAILKAKSAYGKSIEADLAKVIQLLRRNPERLSTCMRAMQISDVPQALLWRRIRALEPKEL